MVEDIRPVKQQFKLHNCHISNFRLQTPQAADKEVATSQRGAHMRTRQYGRSKANSTSASADSTTHHLPGDPSTAKAADYLEYVADVVLELSDMATQADAATLAALMQVAHAEARLQLTLRKSPRS